MKKYVISTIILSIIFIFLLLGSYLFNDDKIKNNVTKGLDNYNFLDNEKYGNRIDNYTDMIILNVITYNSNNSSLKRAFGNEDGILYVDKYGDKEIYWNQYENLRSSLSNTNDDSLFYGRYWHGYQTILRPLLSIFTYEQSLIFLSIIGYILIILSCILVYLKLGLKVLIAYILSLISLNIYVISTCYQYFFSMILMIIFNIVILFKYKKGSNYCFYFYLFGAISAYLLYFSFPLITISFPLLILLLLKYKDGDIQKYKENIVLVFKCSLFWLIGYILFYILKWIFSTIFVSTNFIEDALLSVNQRLGIVFSFKYLDVLKLNLVEFFNHKFNILFLIISIVLIIINLRKNTLNKLKIISPIFLIGMMPFVWMFICNNHSAVHYWMISRILSITIFSLMIIGIVLLENRKCNNIEKLNLNDYYLLLSTILFILLYKVSFIFIILDVILIIILKPNKNVKYFELILIIISCFIFSNKIINKRQFQNKDFYVNVYNELYHKVKYYGYDYIKNNTINEEKKIDIRDLITDINPDSVFLLSCDGYAIIDNNDVTPYINCNNVAITDGYQK